MGLPTRRAINPRHKAKVATLEWFKNSKVNILQWLSQSPDQNPTENLWHYSPGPPSNQSRCSKRMKETTSEQCAKLLVFHFLFLWQQRGLSSKYPSIGVEYLCKHDIFTFNLFVFNCIRQITHLALRNRLKSRSVHHENLMGKYV